MRARRLAALAGCALVGLTGCSGGGGDDGRDVRIRLVVPDRNIRVEGSECAGARPFQYVHAEAPFALEDEDGVVLADGRLPPGRAENAEPGVDWGVERIPTVCVMELELDGVPARSAYRLRLEEGRPLAFDASLLSRDEPVRLVVG